MEKVFLNDCLVDIDKACISVTDSGFLYGAGIFETMRSHNGVVFSLADHLDRLLFSARSLSIDNPYDKSYLTDAIYKVLRANKLAEARLRLTLTGGPMTEPARTSVGRSNEHRKATLLITATQLQPYPPEYYGKGVMVALCPFRQNPGEPTYGHKTTSYFPRLLALKWAHRKGAAEALWFTVDNRLAEGCISNVFLVKDSVLYTPPIRTPVLAGVARKTICQIAVKNSTKFIEKDLYVNDLLDANEVFLTNVIMQVLPVNSIEKHTVGAGKVGPMTKRLHRSFVEIVKRQCGGKNENE